YTFTAPGRQYVTAVAISHSGFIAIGGSSSTDVDFGYGTPQGLEAGVYEGFVVVLDSGCQFQWSRRFAQNAAALAFDASDNLWVSGGGGGASGAQTVLEVGKFGPYGEVLADITSSAAIGVQANGLSVDAAGNCFV